MVAVVVVVVVNIVIVLTVLSSAVGVVSFDTSSVTIHPVSSSRRADRKFSAAVLDMSLSSCSYASISLRRWRSSFADCYVGGTLNTVQHSCLTSRLAVDLWKAGG